MHYKTKELYKNQWKRVNLSLNSIVADKSILKVSPIQQDDVGITKKDGILGKTYSEDEIQEVFQTFDLDNDGNITAKEIMAILRKIGEEATEDEIDEMICMFDTAGRGKIAYHDFFTKIVGYVLLLITKGGRGAFTFRVDRQL